MKEEAQMATTVGMFWSQCHYTLYLHMVEMFIQCNSD